EPSPRIRAGGWRECAKTSLRPEGLAVTPEEGCLRESGQEATPLAEPNRDRRAMADVGERVPVDEHGHVHVEGFVPDFQIDAARDDNRAGVQRVRREEGDDHRIQPSSEYGPAVRQVVRRRAGRTGPD